MNKLRKPYQVLEKDQNFHYIVYYTHAYKTGVGPIVLQNIAIFLVKCSKCCNTLI